MLKTKEIAIEKIYTAPGCCTVSVIMPDGFQKSFGVPQETAAAIIQVAKDDGNVAQHKPQPAYNCHTWRLEDNEYGRFLPEAVRCDIISSMEFTESYDPDPFGDERPRSVVSGRFKARR